MKEMIFACPSCDQHIQCDASHAGENIPCPSCAVLIRVPTAHAIAEVEVPAPVSAPATGTDDAAEDPFNNATHKTDAVSYTSLKTPTESAERTDADEPAKPVETAKKKARRLHFQRLRRLRRKRFPQLRTTSIASALHVMPNCGCQRNRLSNLLERWFQST